MHSATLRPHPFHPHRIEVRSHNPYEVITLADSAATLDGASPAHSRTPQLHGNLARAMNGPWQDFREASGEEQICRCPRQRVFPAGGTGSRVRAAPPSFRV